MIKKKKNKKHIKKKNKKYQKYKIDTNDLFRLKIIDIQKK